MTPEQFCYWLQGAFEIPNGALTKREQVIADHLKTVFDKKTPNYPTYTTTNPILPGTGSPLPNFGGTTIC